MAASRFLRGLLGAVFVAGCSSSIGSLSPRPGTQPPVTGECANVHARPLAPRDVYRVPDESYDLELKCQILSALQTGAFVVAEGEQTTFVDEALDAKPTEPNAKTQTSANGTPGPHETNGPIPSPLPTLRPGQPTPTPHPAGTPGPVVPLPFDAVGYIRISGALRTYEISADSQADAEAGLSAWEAAPLADGPTPPPANKVWSLIGENRQEVIGPEAGWGVFHPLIPTGKLNVLTDVWRLSTNDRHSDYFMVGTVMSSNPNFYEGPGNSCYPICRYWTWRRQQVVKLIPYYGAHATTEDLGPKNGIQVDRVSFEVGGNLGGKIGFGGDKGATGEGNLGISAKYGSSWEQPHAKTINRSSVGATVAEWQDDTLNFMSGIGYDFYAWKNVTTTAAFTNGRVTIFKLPRQNPGSPVNPYVLPELTNYFLVRGSSCAGFCVLSIQADEQEIHIASTQKFPVWMPTFGVDTKSIHVKPKSTVTFRIRVRSSEGENAKAWQIVKDPNDNHLTITPNSGSDSGDRSEYQTISVKAQPGAVSGTTYTLYINTVPAGGSDSLRYGSLRVTVNID
jgi:hypothetical protein